MVWRGHDEREGFENSGVFLGLVDLVASIDSAKEHLESTTVFKGTLKTIVT